MFNEIKKNKLTENEMDSVAGGSPFPNDSLVTEEMKLKREFDNLTPQEQLEVLQQPDAASQKAKLMEILARRGDYSHGSGAHGGW